MSFVVVECLYLIHGNDAKKVIREEWTPLLDTLCNSQCPPGLKCAFGLTEAILF